MAEEQFTTSDLNQRELKFSYWFVKNRDLFKKILTGFLIAVNVLLWGYSIYGALSIWVFHRADYENMLRILPENFANFSGLREVNTPNGLIISKINIISSGEGEYDLVALVQNPNERWVAESFDYKFQVSGAETEVGRGFILPGEDKYITDLSVSSRIRPRNAELNITNINWRRLTPHEVEDVSEYKNSRLNFKVENIEYRPSSVTDGGAPISTVSFDVYNNTAYNYWEVGFYIILRRGASVGGVNYITATEFMSGERRSLEARWFEPLPAVTEVEISPEVKITDPSVYMEFRGESGEFLER